MSLYHYAGHLKFAALLCAALTIGACAKTPGEEGLAGMGAGGGYGHGSAVPGSPEDFAQNVGDRVFFESDQTDLTSKGQATLDNQARWLQQYNRGSITVEGHADERGTREYNFALGARRAESTKEYLVARGIPASRIRTISYGKERPVATCNDISCWSQNRRAVTVIGGGQS
ncbi:peptidoglycan-associated lipoprotein Pal [Beijerinckia sp. L45]|uniref:peptidoglycan-associated lipoprotein Pal n=1 Tax=Beijerinckia sp. L45 TaxID=1641855 RepID=UPI00131BC3DB|nr:peptidoglycan-associated lipoprotein Pal [Beijerinckia sp. L45]